ncbi:hydroxymethylglutaryl-CoA lyase [bacterium]|nr:hydroxymethylglutaryl-CoA lyase [bacterium]
MKQSIKIVECPRDAMQGIAKHIPTELKIRYLNELLQIGFDTLDFGSFVSPKAIPQLADTAEVLAGLDLSETDTKLLAIVANERGAEDACEFPEIHYLGYPFSISETFQLRNTRKTIEESLELTKTLQSLCEKHKKELIVYISMAFGNPYEDPWNMEIVEKWVKEMADIGVKTIALADTVGTADPDTIRQLFGSLIPKFPKVLIGAHFHSHPATRQEKLAAAWESGCRRYDVAMMGFGGCPFAKDDLVGNISTESLLAFCAENKISTALDSKQISQSAETAREVFLVH